MLKLTHLFENVIRDVPNTTEWKNNGGAFSATSTWPLSKFVHALPRSRALPANILCTPSHVRLTSSQLCLPYREASPKLAQKVSYQHLADGSMQLWLEHRPAGGSFNALDNGLVPLTTTKQVRHISLVENSVPSECLAGAGPARWRCAQYAVGNNLPLQC